MAGHSKWANTKHRKARADAQKGKIFTKLAREITVAAREGGDDLDANFTLRLAVQKARDNNMPNENIQRSIQRGTGNQEGSSYEQAYYEGYAVDGVAVLLEVMTDNRNRTVAEIRHIFSRYNGSLGESGCVAWMFDNMGVLSFEKELYSDEDLLEAGLDAGVEDIEDDGEVWQVMCAPENFVSVKNVYDQAGIKYVEAQVTMVPKNTVEVDVETGRRLLKLYEAIDDHEDVQNVYSNFDLPEELLKELE